MLINLKDCIERIKSEEKQGFLELGSKEVSNDSEGKVILQSITVKPLF